ncbi:MAG: mannitol dehydrogenase family protein, partial [Defluviitaleaceae bacterium]|nr:mannitol dehydrogenase family protein [Defluviitaleaceae bacterium]
KLPMFDYDAMKQATDDAPAWVHFGAGNIFRGYVARLQQALLNKGLVKTGIIAVETFDFDIIDKIYAPHDNLALLATLNPDGSVDKEIVASMAQGLRGDAHRAQIAAIFRNPSLQMASLTITEKGYAIRDMSGGFLPQIKADIKAGPDSCVHVISMITSLCYQRYCAGNFPISLVSMDNCSHNGDLLKNAVVTIAKTWADGGFVTHNFIEYLEGGQVGYPLTMIDKITPRPSEDVLKLLADDGIMGMEPIVTGKGTFIAPFVNAEGPEYLVIEDIFPNGRPCLEHAGALFTDRDTVNLTETMKVTTCLNPLHTALAVFGCLLGYKTIAAEMADADLRRLVEKIGYDEGLKVVADPKIINPKAFIDEVINVRLPNPFIPDAPQRIATDTSQKVPIRFGKTIQAYMAAENLCPSELTAIPLSIAAWMRYLLAVDDNLAPMELSPDPLLDTLKPTLAGITPGKPESYNGQLKEILENPAFFSVNLYEAGLGEKIEGMFVEMLGGVGAVRATLKKTIY